MGYIMSLSKLCFLNATRCCKTQIPPSATIRNQYSESVSRVANGVFFWQTNLRTDNQNNCEDMIRYQYSFQSFSRSIEGLGSCRCGL